LFEMESVRAPQVEAKLRHFEDLTRKRKKKPLTPEEIQQYEQLSLELENIPASPTSQERALENELREKVTKRRDLISQLE